MHVPCIICDVPVDGIHYVSHRSGPWLDPWPPEELQFSQCALSQMVSKGLSPLILSTVTKDLLNTSYFLMLNSVSQEEKLFEKGSLNMRCFMGWGKGE